MKSFSTDPVGDRRCAYQLSKSGIARRSTLVFLQEPPDVTLDRRRIERSEGMLDTIGEASQTDLYATRELLVHGPFLLAPLGRPGQRHGVARLGAAREPDLDAFA